MKECIIICLVLMIILVIGIGYVTTASANAQYKRAEAEAMVIRAQGQARIDAATATAILSVAVLPWAVLGVLGLFGFCVLALCVVLIIRRPVVIATPPQIIDRQICYLPRPGQPRRETWQTLSGEFYEVSADDRSIVCQDQGL